MVIIKHYYDQQRELNIAKLRLKTLKEKRYLYFSNTQPGGMRFDEPMVMGGAITNSFDIYVEKTEDIDVQIKLVEAEIIILQENLKDMEHELRQMEGVLEKIFVARYIDGLSVNQICRQLHYGKSEVYRKLKIIRKILKWGKNGKDFML